MLSTQIERISINDFLQQHLKISQDACQAYSLDMVDGLKNREAGFLRFLPPRLVRRLDAGFARSYTVHPETALALYSICRATKATCVFETGTYWGYSTAYLAAALEDIGEDGKVYTFDIYPQAGKHIPRHLSHRVQLCRGQASIESMPTVLAQVTPDIFFQDSRHDYLGVLEELQVVSPYLKLGAIVLFHDFIEEEVRRAALEGLPGYSFYTLDIGDPQQLGIAVKA
jgi:predicted O-methyltransferase YrrM